MFGKETDMRHLFSSPVVRRATVVLFAAVTILALAAPAIANAAAVPSPTISISTRSMVSAKQFNLAGKIAKSAAGKILVVEVKKPGSTRWSYSSNRGITRTGAWLYRYMPRLKGTYQFRARYTTRYGTRVSSVVSMWLKTQPVWDLIVASTSSTADSGLFEAMIPAFERQYPYWRVKVIAKGSGDAINLGKSKDADVLVTHEPVGEVAFVTTGPTPGTTWGFNRHSFMYNDFVLLGPTADPAAIKTNHPNSIVAAFNALRTLNTPTISANVRYLTRTGTSGTAIKNKYIWAQTTAGEPVFEVPPGWYIGTGNQMGAAILLASGSSPVNYLLADRATYLNIQPTNMAIVCENDPTLVKGTTNTKILDNPYSVMEVTGARNAAGGADWSNWLRGPAGQKLIGNYGVSRFGKPLFTPWVIPAAGAY
jgi:tungstate transport system substrate-binding protein